MVEKQKRLKKNISFSEHEKDIYDFLEEQGNASAFIKKLIREQMYLQRGIMGAVVNYNKETKVDVVPQETQLVNNNNNNILETNNIKNDETVVNSQDYTVVMNLTKEDLENKALIPEI